MNIYTSETEYLKTEVQRLSALVRAQQITIDKLEAQRQWVGIDDDDISALGLSIAKARALESLLKRRNT
jgi:hypothetical protein